ncbi:MAG: hypothetical protein IBJ12_10935 [Sphingomonadaceae bacterium]|nr:hypothetical protein [Sphingomonadaceae bacterium]
MRLLIYLLAMLTGFSAAEAARPMSVTPASVDAAVGEAYAEAAVNIAEQAQISSECTDPVATASISEIPLATEFSAIAGTTPVSRRDVILG